jgi:NAD(P)-dependent dehydrogenase (short-subunit alcohol dehydrogenase family)
MAAGGGRRLEGRIALVTGASRGIGAAVARRFAEEGAKLVLVARTVGGLEELDDDIRSTGAEPATLVPADLTDFPEIDRLGAALYARHGRLDVLVGNAGMLGMLGPASHVDPQTWQRTVDLNLTANWRLIRSMEPLLRRSEAGRAIFVTSAVTQAHRPKGAWRMLKKFLKRRLLASGAPEAPLPYWAPYAATKAALETLALSWAVELERTAVRVNLLDPGIVRTKMRLQAFPAENADALPAPESVTEAFVRLAMASWTQTGQRLKAADLR